ncbi:transmembrane transporter [Schizosaccharomyces pombe]|uniref:Uncharacterized MFS-type transporter C613.02 n=1 Tax=Schizosaccharomyces pombe (strain 972 / ATCC 24843) TaxID=284812 RepID=YCS2_SCHPO|nr:putative transporter [Schizosaccharomyces pombe]O74902.1 RecName: Full=Uncharacterized MFS-type transporter C613.02 [Schizosaccharomyces pombe 972h-]CAA21054.1 membrane transporter (predicted) [Schizosaccharomyces pombe]|eukprot:NP_587690.1 putative transporter [Schizosaccharomyces pombe]
MSISIETITKRNQYRVDQPQRQPSRLSTVASISEYQSDYSKTVFEEIELEVIPNKQNISTRSFRNDGNDSDPQTLDPDAYPPKRSIAFVLLNSILSDMSMSTALPISAAYTEILGGTDAFSGLVIGIPTMISLVCLYPMLRFANPKSANGYTLYFRPLIVSCISQIIGHLLYSLAYRAQWLYLILIGRMCNGVGFTMFLYHKKYLTDKHFVGQNRSTFLATLNILAQTVGFMAGSFLGGLLAKACMHLTNPIWNQYTVGSWFMLFAWCIYGILLSIFFKEIRADGNDSSARKPENFNGQAVKLSYTHKFMLVFLSMVAFISYFNIAGYQASVPIYAKELYHYNAFQSGNFLSLSALVIAPLVFLSTFLSKWAEDRDMMLYGFILGILALVVHLVLDVLHKVRVQPYFVLYSAMQFGFSIGSAPLISLATKQLHPKYHILVGIIVQIGISAADTVGAICGGAIFDITTVGFIALNLGIAVLVFIQLLFLWNSIKTKTG